MSFTRTAFLLLAIAAPVIGRAAPAAPVVMLLELTGVPGESTDAKRPNTIDETSFSIGVSVPSSGSIGAGGGTVSKPSFANLTVTKYIDKSTPTLFLNAASGVHLAKATLYVRPTNASSESYKLILQDVTISAVNSNGAAGGDRPTESLSLAFAKIQWFYQAFDANGAPSGTAVVTGWDIQRNIRL